MLQYAALLSRPPRSIAVREADALPLDVAWLLRSWSSGVLVEILEHGKVSLQHRNELPKGLRLSLEAVDVHSQFEFQRSTRLGHLMPMMKILNGLFKSNGDQQPHDDCCEMDKEVLSRSYCFVVSVNIEHSR